MTTYTWSAPLPIDSWITAGDWTPAAVPGPGDAALIGYGTVELSGVAPRNITITLQPILHAAGVTLAASNIDFGDNTVLAVAAPATPGQPVVLNVIGSGMLDDGNQVPNLTPLPGTIDFSAGSSLVNLTIELSAGPGVPATASFVNDGVIRGNYLTVTADAGTAATFFNNTAITITGGLTVDAGVALDGTGVIVLDGGGAHASINGVVDAGQTIAFIGGVQNTLTLGDIAQFRGTVDITHESQIVVQGVSLASVSNSMATFSDGSTLDLVPTGSGGDVSAETTFVFNAALGQAEPEVLIDATESGLPCFCAGTRIATPDGEAPVEMLRVGDMVRLAGGGTARVAWVGHREVRCGQHRRPHDVWPVRIQAGAFGPAVPSRDLWLSPDHAVAMAGALIPVRHLVNGATVAQQRAAVARYHHVELARHDLLLAEGLPVESYLDTGNRAAFVDGGPALALHPDFSRRVWTQAGCAPLVESGPALATARKELLRQARRLGHRRTRDPGLRVLADGRMLGAEAGIGGWLVHLPPGVRELRLLSRIWVPAQMRPDAEDTRCLGASIVRLHVDGREIGLDSPALAHGWHAAEPDMRWTNGDAVLAVAGVRTLGFALATTGVYWRAAPAGAPGVRSARARPSARPTQGIPAR